MANTRDVHSILTSTYKQISGQADIATINYDGVVTASQSWSDSQKDAFVNSLSNGYMNEAIYTDREYVDRYNDIFYENSDMFGAITRVIDIEIPDTIKSSAWETFVSGTSTIGSHTIYLPAVNEQLYINSDSWAVPLTVSGQQYRSAFSSASGMAQFDNYLRLSAQNSVKIHRAEMNSINRNNYLITKVTLMNQANKKHVVNLVEEYCTDTGTASLTADVYRKTPVCLRHAVKTFKKYKALTMIPSTLFTASTTTNGKFCPEDRFVMQVLSDFEADIISEMYSNTYHDEFVKMPLYRDCPTWQGLKDSNGKLNFTQLSQVIGTPAGESSSNSASGIVAFMCDKYAIMHTNVYNRVGVDVDNIRDVTYYEYQYTDKYMNNMNLNGVVFYLGDVS